MSQAPYAVPTATSKEELRELIATNGFCVYPSVVGDAAIEKLLGAFERAKDSPHARSQDGDTYALRNVLEAIPEVFDVATSEELLELVKAVLSGVERPDGSEVLSQKTRPIKAILFDKTEGVNWSLRWHQDNVISIKERPANTDELEGFEAWSEKVGVPHVRPPVAILQNILAARIHIGDCPADNGALQVIPGSHAKGRLSDDEILEWRNSGKSVICPALKGDVLFMRPLLLHSSSKSEKPLHRRVLHIEYTAIDLPGGLEWGV
jgi:Protein involved in biosynthesis of mitomycin antibiotics/polyketide fumonisin